MVHPRVYEHRRDQNRVADADRNVRDIECDSAADKRIGNAVPRDAGNDRAERAARCDAGAQRDTDRRHARRKREQHDGERHGEDEDARRSRMVERCRRQRLMDEIERSGVSLPPDYTFLPRSFDGFSYLYLIPLKERYPRDYERVLEWFPLARAELLRFEISQRLNPT